MITPVAPGADGHRPHDLLWLADPAALVGADPLPAWATPAWLAAAPVVVRRATIDAGRVPVGLRGTTRHQRCAAHVAASAVFRSMAPEAVLDAWLQRGAKNPRGLPCLDTLAALVPVLHGLPFAWGVTGSVGFTLASGIDVLRDDSDLDLLVRAPSPTDTSLLREIAATLHGRPARVDLQVETPAGAFALLEWSRTGGAVLLKTTLGPVLSDDPWRLSQREAPA
ncbi:MAG: malonate decarboxylase holo-ACP synthase [Reyranella sp.]